jgi:MoaA/NifB/PqqE/SkfB family radical SAM enzyme
VIEWQSEWNSFNSYKGLLYKQWYDGIIAGNFLPPIEASVDPVNDCNLNCFWCNGVEPKSRKVMMSHDHLIDLCYFFKKWGVKAVCFAGGGEPTMHRGLWQAFDVLKDLGLPSAIITNGLFLDRRQMESIARNSTWCGISVDAAKPETYMKIKGANEYKTIIRNICTLLEQGINELTFKFLIHPINQYEIYDAIRTASHLGCHAIHIRPIAFKCFQKHEEPYDIRKINMQIKQGFIDFGNKIKIFAVRHKYNSEMHADINFKKCLATPIMPIFQADGWMSACIDQKHEKGLRLCRHDNPDDILKFWGSKEHKAILDKIDVSKCPKCTLNKYNEQIEHAIIKNEMNWQFT